MGVNWVCGRNKNKIKGGNRMDFLRIAGKDIKNIFKNRFIRVCVIAIIVVPLLYSLLYLKAFWDPYSKLADMPVAVVNLDEGTTLDGETVKYGDGIVDNLKSNEIVGWKFVSQDEADRGLEGDKYYAKFEISKDFSKEIVSAKSGTPTQAGLKFVCNEKKNFLASQVNSKVESALKAQITETITNNYVTASFDNLYTVKDGMSAAADGSSQINAGLKTLKDSAPVLEDGVNQLNSGSTQLNNGQIDLNSGLGPLNSGLGTLNSGLGTLNNGLATLNGKTSSLTAGADKLYSGSTSLASGTSTLYDGYTNKIYPGITQLNSGASQLKQNLDAGAAEIKNLGDSVVPLQQASNKTNNDTNNIFIGYASLKTGIDGILSSGLDSATKKTMINEALNQFETIGLTKYTDNVTTFATGTGNLVGKVNTVSGYVTTINSGLSAIQIGLDGTETTPGFTSGLTSLNNGAQALNVGLKQLNSQVPALTTGISQLYDGSTAAYAGSNKLYTGSSQALAGSNALVTGQTQLNDGLRSLSDQIPQLNDGVTKLYDGSNELSTKLSDGSSKLSSGLVNTPEVMGSFVSSPVELKIEPINSVPNYGTGFAPYFINLSLWIGAIMMFFVISTKTEEHKEASRFAKAFGKYLSFAFVGVLQAVLVGIAVLLLGLSPESISLYFGAIIFFSLVYVAIVQCLISLFGDAGRLLSIVLLILQLTACAGTFPLELVPHFFVVLNPLMPFTYSVEALREITSASVINYSVVFNDLAVLGVMLLGFLTVSIVFHTLGEKIQNAIEGKKEEAM